jgi:MFS family permease
MTSSSPSRAPSTTRPYAVIAVIFILIEATGIFEQVMAYTAIPTLMRVFKMDAAGVSWVVTVFLLVGAGTAAISGRLADIYGRKKVLLILMVLSTIGSIVSVAFGTFAGLIVGRGLQGTSAALFPILVGIAREVVPAPRVPVLVSIITGTAALAGAAASLIAGVLLDHGSWRIMFLCSGALAVVALLASFGLPRAIVVPIPRTRLDVLGAILLAPAVASILYGVNTAREDRWTTEVISYIVVGVALIAFWIVWELRVENPMFNLRLFRQSAISLALATTGLIGLGVFAASALLSPILMQSPKILPIGLGLTATHAGLYGLIAGGVGFAMSPVGGALASRYGAKFALVIGIVIAVIGFAGFAISVHNLTLAVLSSVVGGLGTSFILVGLPNMIVEAVPAQNTGEAVGMVYQVGRTLFTAVGTTVTGIILTSSVVPGTKASTLTAWHRGIGFMAATGLLALGLALFIRKAKPMSDRGNVIEAEEEPFEQSLNNASGRIPESDQRIPS